MSTTFLSYFLLICGNVNISADVEIYQSIKKIEATLKSSSLKRLRGTTDFIAISHSQSLSSTQYQKMFKKICRSGFCKFFTSYIRLCTKCILCNMRTSSQAVQLCILLEFGLHASRSTLSEKEKNANS